jgi:hypothetical protein
MTEPRGALTPFAHLDIMRPTSFTRVMVVALLVAALVLPVFASVTAP